MKVTLNWLNEYVKIDDLSVDFIKDKLLNIGLEVESAIYLGQDIDKVFTCKITEMHKHPKTDKLFVCLVDIGADEKIQIVTGATNIKAEDMSCVVLDGGRLPGKAIGTADFKGEISHGMLCSGAELRITNAVIDGAEDDGLLILPPDTPVGMDIKRFLGLNDYVLDVAVTANRGDCHSVYGIARELAVTLNRELKPLALDYEVCERRAKTRQSHDIAVITKDKKLCPMYQGAVISDIAIRPSPLWLRRRLWACGHSCRNNIVDITNYVLLEVGQPLHAFDLTAIEGDINVRTAAKNEKITALDGIVYDLDENMMLIADDKKALAIAGIMGGEFSGISENTTAVFLESARFARGSVRQTSRALGLRSDSSSRFEKGVDYFSVETGRERALALIDELNAGKIRCNLIEDKAEIPKEKVLDIKYAQFKQILGINVPRKAIKEILTRLSFKVEEITPKSPAMDHPAPPPRPLSEMSSWGTPREGNEEAFVGTPPREGNPQSSAADLNSTLHSPLSTLTPTSSLRVTVPLFREDIDNFTDLIEEVVRFYGYDKLRGTRYKSGIGQSGGISKRRENINKIEEICCAAGAFEINNFSFIPARHLDMLCLPEDDKLCKAIRLINPISEDCAFMRTQLLSSMLETIRRNQARQNEDFALFEIDNVFIADSLPLETLPQENLTLCVGFCQKGKDIFDVKAFAAALIEEFTKEFEFAPICPTDKPFLHPLIGCEIRLFTQGKAGEKEKLASEKGGDNSGISTGYFGKIHPKTAKNFEIKGDVYILELNLEPLLGMEKPPVRFVPLPKFPSVERDFAVTIDAGRPAGEIVAIVKNADKLIKNVEIFDIYTGEQAGEGKKSIAFKVTLLNREKTMTEGEINAVCEKVVLDLAAAGARLR
ncbi:MAG: phenylalanine--tRNA ligase subunit beta [Firmicutes bacterium]|nr:phenylalanine--tRNA ligase subunit beta [Bacillota bacterium]